MTDINRVIIAGRLGQQPESKYTKSGAAMCDLSVATSTYFKPDGSDSWQEKTVWHKVVLFDERKVNRIVSGANKGQMVLVEGSIEVNKWQDDQGNNREKQYIKAYNVTPIGSGDHPSHVSPDRRNENGTQKSAIAPPQNNTNPFADDDIPFY